MGARCQCHLCRLADVDRTIIEHDDGGLGPHAGFGAIEPVESFQKGDEAAMANRRDTSFGGFMDVAAEFQRSAQATHGP